MPILNNEVFFLFLVCRFNYSNSLWICRLSQSLCHYGTKLLNTFLLQQQKFQGAKVSLELKFQGAKSQWEPWNFCFLDLLFPVCNICTREWKVLGVKSWYCWGKLPAPATLWTWHCQQSCPGTQLTQPLGAHSLVPACHYEGPPSRVLLLITNSNPNLSAT